MNVSFTRLAFAITLIFSGAVQAADPPASKPADKPAQATPAPASAHAPLKLGIGDVRKYMTPNEYRAAIQAPDAEQDTIVVEGDRPAPPLKSEQPLPGGLAAYYSLFRHPTTAWRMFLPDPNGV